MSYRIKDLPLDERPREKLLLKGTNALSNEELIAILLQTGYKDRSVKELAIEVSKSIQSIKDLSNITVNDLTKIKGIKEAKAITIIAAVELGLRVTKYREDKYKITTAEDIYYYLYPKIINNKQEHLFAIYLNNKNEVIADKTIFIGTQNKAITHPREVFFYAVKYSAVKVIIAHNHPSGDVNPSLEDKKFTDTIFKTGELLQIPLIDHVILGDQTYFSFFDNHLL